MTSPWILATRNPGKVAEFQRLLHPLGHDLLSQEALGIPEAPEPHCTFLENALSKARHACALSGYPALADDSGLCVEALEGAPGVISAHFAGEPRSDQRNNEKLIRLLREQPNRRAYYYCILVWLRHAQDPTPLIAEGRWEGEIQLNAQGLGGFGYDPLFYLPDMGCTAAELSLTQKNQISHRGQALRQLLHQLQQRSE